MLCMKRGDFFLIVSALLVTLLSGVATANDGNKLLTNELRDSYRAWRSAVIKKDLRAWEQSTAEHRKLAIKNRILSERRAFPQALFALPADPPALTKLKALRAHQSGRTASAVYFGEVDFGVGGKPTENVLLLHFVRERTGWKYDTADFISLQSLPDVRRKLRAGDASFADQQDCLPTGVVPPMPIAVGPAEFIAKVYVFCPGREVRVKVNRISDHRFQDTKAAEVVVGGGVKGLNDVQFATKSLEGSTGKEALSVRVYLMSTAQGVPPLKVFEYQVNEGQPVKPFGSGDFFVDAQVEKKLKG